MICRKPSFVTVAAVILAVAQAVTARGQEFLFTTLAGEPGSYGYADGTNSAARFQRPTGIAIAASGDIYVTDTFNHLIRKCTANGVVSTIAGEINPGKQRDGTGREARFFLPSAIAIASNGDLIVADQTTVRRVTVDGVVTTIAGKPGSLNRNPSSDGEGTNATFHGPIGGLAIGSKDNIYVADIGDHTIRVIALDLTVTTLAGDHGIGGGADGWGEAAQFNSPVFCALDKTGSLFVGDQMNQNVRRVTPKGLVTTVAGSTTYRNGEVYWQGVMQDGTGPGARFRSPSGLALDSKGDLFLGDSSTLRKMTPSGSVTTVAGNPYISGSADGLSSQARFHEVGGIAFDSAGNIFLADIDNHTIRKGTRINVGIIKNRRAVNELVPTNSVVAGKTNSGREHVLTNAVWRYPTSR